MKTETKNIECTELSKEEYATIHGGESLWYWVGYGAGVVSQEAKELVVDFYIMAQTNRALFLM